MTSTSKICPKSILMFARSMPVGHDFGTMLLRTSINLARVFLAVLVIVAAYKSQAQVFDFEHSHPTSVSLEGQWRFHWGDDPDGKLGWADPAFDDSQWTLLRSSRTWSEKGYKDYSGFAWYRFKVIVPHSLDIRNSYPSIAHQLRNFRRW